MPHVFRFHKGSETIEGWQETTQLVLTRLNGKYSVNDPFFALWINRMYGTKQLSQLIDYQE